MRKEGEDHEKKGRCREKDEVYERKNEFVRDESRDDRVSLALTRFLNIFLYGVKTNI